MENQIDPGTGLVMTAEEIAALEALPNVIGVEAVPETGTKVCEVCGCTMTGPGIDENTVCAEAQSHPVVEAATVVTTPEQVVETPAEEVIAE